MEDAMWRLSRAKAMASLAGTMLVFATLACIGRAPQNMELLSQYAPGGPYWACATPTPIPPEIVVLEWQTTNVPKVWITKTPPPTATPYYRWSEFNLNQAATNGNFQITLKSVSQSSGFTIAKFEVINHGVSPAALILSHVIYVEGSDGSPRQHSNADRAAAGLPPVESESNEIQPDEKREMSLTFSGSPRRFGMKLDALSSSSAKTAWFNDGYDTVPCPHGPADYPPAIANPDWARGKQPSNYTGPKVISGAGYPLVSPGFWPGFPKQGGFVCDWGGGYRMWGCANFHNGYDLLAPQGTPVIAVVPGEVWFARRADRKDTVIDSNYGNLVILRQKVEDNRYVFFYQAHLDSITVSEGASVQCGQVIGTLGNTGYSFGAHLHWETRVSPKSSGASFIESLDPNSTRPLWDRLCRYSDNSGNQ
jgi:murein DD-endopeptidase MepM/ murein hydrolase activator NlpD